MAARNLALALALGIAASTTAVPADAGADWPVSIVVVGHGAIRLRLAAGRTMPCDSSSNRMLFDGWVGVGRYEWATGTDVVCFEHTSGALRESDWSGAHLAPTVTRDWRWGPNRPNVIQISTD
jgi:hypothetical protein